ncbi:type II toxin-antitoxin system RelE/ParE family toxin [Candidatus Saganbacteria bacterium]|nr:type II toxin-antitoxin system RelE/ParE family toxin [Candidatus Saganbacteria bacterium]
MYNIAFHNIAAKRFAKLDKDLRSRIAEFIDSLAINPYLGKKLSGKLEGDYRIRIGNYRVIYRIIHEQKIILILNVGSRGDVYK